MTTILYPTRGGQSSYANQDRVIALAKEREAELIFLYVSDVRFLDRLGHAARAGFIEEELDEMGEFLLAMAQERAEKAGWRASMAVRRGNFIEALADVIEEFNVDTLVVGAPGSTHAVTTTEYLKNLVKAIRGDHQIEVFVINEGEIIQLKEG